MSTGELTQLLWILWHSPICFHTFLFPRNHPPATDPPYLTWKALIPHSPARFSLFKKFLSKEGENSSPVRGEQLNSTGMGGEGAQAETEASALQEASGVH